jgi:hypothetical protein
MIIKPNMKAINDLGTPEQRAKWVKGMRSVKYEQIQGSMCESHIKNSACCLHVAAMEVDGIPWEHGIGYGFPDDHKGWNFSNLARKSRIGLSDSHAVTPSRLNDFYGATFDQIADLLEGKEIEVQA